VQIHDGHRQLSEAIVTRDHVSAMRFVREVDSSSVMVNANEHGPVVWTLTNGRFLPSAFTVRRTTIVRLSSTTHSTSSPFSISNACANGDGQIK
jgi:hypothetical protein